MTDNLIYTLPDGSRSYDPLSVRRKLLLSSRNQLNQWIALYNDGIEELDRLAAEDNLIAVTRMAMELRPATEPAGVTDQQVLEYLSHLLEWLSAPVKKSTAPLQIDQPCLECLPATRPTVP